MVANGVEETVTNDRGNQLLSKERQEYAADGSKVEVVDLEQEVELEWLTATHQLATAEDDDVVCDEEGRAALECRERSLARHEAEILRLVASNRLESLLEDRPQRDTEGAIQRRDAHLKPIETHCVLCARIDAGEQALRAPRWYMRRAVGVNKQAHVKTVAAEAKGTTKKGVKKKTQTPQRCEEEVIQRGFCWSNANVFRNQPKGGRR